MEPLVIRRAEKNDLRFILLLYRELDEVYAGQDAGEHILAADIAWLRISSDSRQHLLVAEIAGEIVGTLTLIIVPNIGHKGSPWGAIENVVVKGNRRGRGLGKSLMREATAIARERGCYKLILSSNVLRTEAHEFYRELGWRETHVGFSLDIEK